MSDQCLQETYAPHNACFGCGQANDLGLGLQSFPEGDEVVALFRPQDHHQAFPNVLNGGIIGSILDCHCNWTAAWHLMREHGTEKPPCTVTMEYTIRLLRPTPMDGPIELRARVRESDGRKVSVEATLTAGGHVCASCSGRFASVPPGHPAYNAW
ncbi:MAG: PaaI family thioesterase [Pseudomonadota bacterium]